MEFHKIEVEDMSFLRGYLLKQPYRSCDFSVNTLFLWRHYFDYHYAISHDCLIIKAITDEGYNVFSFPVGDGDVKKALIDLKKCCEEEKMILRFMTVPKDGATILEEVFKEHKLDIMPVRKWYDYIYDINDLVKLIGKKNARHRNQINKFKRSYPNYKLKCISNEGDIKKAKAFLHEFAAQPEFQHVENHETNDYEISELEEVFDNFFTLGFKGAYLEVNNRLVALTYGDVIDDTLYVHVEKALRSYEGSYAMINQLFASEYQSLVKYVNREDDLDEPGLRYAKESYNPIYLLEKFNVDIY